MNPNPLKEENPGQSARRDPVSASGALEDVQSLWHELHGLTHDRFRLAALETQRAGKSLVIMIVAGAMIAVLLSCAWRGLVAAAVLGLVENGIVASIAIVLAVAFNLLLALILYGMIRRKSRYLKLPRDPAQSSDPATRSPGRGEVMMKVYIPIRSKPISLTAQIRDAEREILNHQQRVDALTATLIPKIHQQMTAPGTLLLAGGIGFILGEFTKRQTPKYGGADDKPRTAETTPWRTAMNLITTAKTLYSALPLA
jgi:hypothetical protein